MTNRPEAQASLKRARNYIDGHWVDAVAGAIAEVHNPATGEVIGEAPSSTAADVDLAVEAAAAGLDDWRDATPAERSDILIRLAQRLEDEASELTRLESQNSGKPIKASLHELEYTIDELRFTAGAARTLDGLSTGEYARGFTSMIRREPIGVVGHIDPWNYPLMISTTKMASALAVGNTAVVKPSELTPLPFLRLMELAEGLFPAGVVNVVCGAGVPVGERLSSHPGVGLVSLTGETTTGVAVATSAAPTLKKLHLELGGKAPVVVFDDADPSLVVPALRFGGFYNAGQDCGAACRVLAGPTIYGRLIDELIPAVESLVVADPAIGERVEMGPVISSDQQARVLGFVDRAVDAGASLATGGDSGSPDGAFVSPTVLTEVAQDSEIVQREVFGPVITVQRCEDEDQALQWANDTSTGLAASVFTSDFGRGMRMARALHFGTVWVNDHMPVVCEMPWGGFQQSGYGKEHSIYALEAYTQIKHVMARHA